MSRSMQKSRGSLLISAVFPLLLVMACGPVQPHEISCADEFACSGHGFCDETSGTPTCVCDGNWTGPTCDRCLEGYVDNGQGSCVVENSCESWCAALGRHCEGTAGGDYQCGECLE